MWRITGEQERIGNFRLPRLVRDMVHGEAGYTARVAFGVDYADRGKEHKRLWINGNNVLYKADEIPRLYEEEPDSALIQVVRVIGQPRGKAAPIDGVSIDDSFYGPVERTHSDDLIQYYDTETEGWHKMRVLQGGYASNEVSAAFMRHALMEQFAIDLGRNALFDIVPHPEGLT